MVVPRSVSVTTAVPLVPGSRATDLTFGRSVPTLIPYAAASAALEPGGGRLLVRAVHAAARVRRVEDDRHERVGHLSSRSAVP